MVLVPIIVRPLPGQSAAPVMRILGTSPLIAFDGLPPHQRRYLAYLVEWTLAMRPDGAGSSGLPAEILDVDTFIRLCFDGQWKAFSEAVAQHDPDAAPVYYAEEWTCVDLSIVTVPTKVLWVLRDPRDAWAEDGDRATSLEDFIASVRAHSRHERSEGDLVVRYEDLIGDPASEVGRLSDWLGVSFEDVSPEPTGSGTAARREAGDASASERHLLTRELADALEGWGYPHQD